MNPDLADSHFADHFAYHTEPIRNAVLATFALAVVALLMPFLLFQLMVLCVAAGPGSWALINWLRRGRGVQLDADCLVVQGATTGRRRRIPYRRMLGYTTRGRDVIAGWLAEEAPDNSPPVRNGQPALTDLRPETHHYPRRRLVESAPLAQPEAFLMALAARLEQAPPTVDSFSSGDLLLWANRRRRRDTILLILGVLATPLYVVIIGHFLGIIFSLRGN